MKIQGNTLMLEWRDLIMAGVSELTLKSASERNSASWPFEKDPSDRRRLLIAYDRLADKYRTMVQAVFGNPYEHMAAQMLLPHLHCPEADRTFILAYKANGIALTPDQQQRYIQACSYLKLFDCAKHQWKALGYTSRPQFEAAISSLIKANDVGLPAHPKSLCKKLSEYRTQGTIAVIPGQIGNSNASKLGPEQQDWIKSAYADHRKPTVELIHRLYLLHAQEVEWPTISLSTVKGFLAKASIAQQVHIERDQKHWKNTYGFTIKTAKPTAPDALVESDGTKLNLFYMDGGKMKADLQMYIVVDVATEMMIGYSFGRSENIDTVQRAWRMAIKRSGRLPKQTRFDNGGAHKSAEVKAFMKCISDVHFNSTAYSGQSKYIERIIGRFQRAHLALFHNFTGMNVKAKHKDSQLNESWLKQNKHAIPTLEGAIHDTVTALEAWNNTIIREGKTRAELYYADNTAGRTLTEQDRCNLFYTERPNTITYRKHGLELRVNNKRLYYEVYDDQGNPDMEFHYAHTGDTFRVKYDPDDLSQVFLLSADGRLVAKAQSTVTVPGALHDYTEGSRKAINTRLAAKKKQVLDISTLISEAKNEHQPLLTHSSVYKDALGRAEEELLLAGVDEAAPLPKLNARQIYQNPFIDQDFKEGGILPDVEEEN